MRFVIILFISLFLSGCFTPVTNIEEYASRRSDKESNIKTLDELLKKTFTDEAYEAIKDIPLEKGPIGSAMAAGSSIPSSIYQFLTGGGIGRKVLVNDEMLKRPDHGFSSIIHEYVHHLDDITRDGEGEFINIDSFIIGYATCYKTQQYHGIVLFTEGNQANFITDVFGIGSHSERIAYCSQLIWRQEIPLPLRVAFSRIFRRFEHNTTIPNGYKIEVNKDFLDYLQSQ